MSNKLSHTPVEAKNRIDALDITRGIALLGILLMNITGFGLHWMAYDDPTVQGGAEGKDLLVWIINFLFFEGTMRGLFSMLFGVGMILMTSRMEMMGGGIEVADVYYRRNLWLLLFGVIHAYLLLWPGEILYTYAIFGMMIFAFRKVKPKYLLILAAVLTLSGMVLRTYKYSTNIVAYEKYVEAAEYESEEALPKDILEGKEHWEEIMVEMKPDEKTVESATQAMHKNYFSLVMTLAPYNRMMQTEFIYDYYVWDVLVMMLIGIALYQMKIITAEKSFKFYAFMVVLGYGVGLIINYLELQLILESDFSIKSFLDAGLTYPIGRIAMTFGHIGLIMIFCKSDIFGWLRTSLAGVGRMALTNYIMHSVICAFVFTGIGFSLFGQLQRFELYYVVAAIWLFQMIVSPIWLRYYKYGPLEWLWRSLTYGRKQSFKR